MNYMWYNLALTAIVTIGVIVAIALYLVLLSRQLRNLQRDVLGELERLRITLTTRQLEQRPSQGQYPSGNAPGSGVAPPHG